MAVTSRLQTMANITARSELMSSESMLFLGRWPAATSEAITAELTGTEVPVIATNSGLEVLDMLLLGVLLAVFRLDLLLVSYRLARATFRSSFVTCPIYKTLLLRGYEG